MSGTFLSFDRQVGTQATRAEVKANYERDTVSPVNGEKRSGAFSDKILMFSLGVALQ